MPRHDKNCISFCMPAEEVAEFRKKAKELHMPVCKLARLWIRSCLEANRSTNHQTGE